MLFNYRCLDAWWRKRLVSAAEVDTFSCWREKKKKVGPSQPLLRNPLLAEQCGSFANSKYFCLSHECKACLVCVVSVEHAGSHSQPLSSRNTVRIRDGTAVVLNLDWTVVKLDLWFITSVTLHVLQLNRVMSSAGKRGKVQFWEEPEGIWNPKAYSKTVAEMFTSLHEPWTGSVDEGRRLKLI